MIVCSRPVLGSWDDAYKLANAAVAQMTLSEKIGIIKGTGQLNGNRKISTMLPAHHDPFPINMLNTVLSQDGVLAIQRLFLVSEFLQFASTMVQQGYV